MNIIAHPTRRTNELNEHKRNKHHMKRGMNANISNQHIVALEHNIHGRSEEREEEKDNKIKGVVGVDPPHKNRRPKPHKKTRNLLVLLNQKQRTSQVSRPPNDDDAYHYSPSHLRRADPRAHVHVPHKVEYVQQLLRLRHGVRL
jgi:hypothetical protein